MENMNPDQIITAIFAFTMMGCIIWGIYGIFHVALSQNREYEERKHLASTIKVGDILHVYHHNSNPYHRNHFYVRVMEIKEGYAQIRYTDNSGCSVNFTSLLKEGWEIIENPTPEQISMFKK